MPVRDRLLGRLRSLRRLRWDTHANHFPRLKDYLLPGFDRAFSGLILDLESRGLLDETLVMWLSEHGRTPLIDSKPKGQGGITGPRVLGSLRRRWSGRRPGGRTN